MLDPPDLLRLARLYGAAKRISLFTVGRQACGGNNRIFQRLEQGHGAHSSTLQQLETFFRANWPPNAPWPSDIQPGLSKRRRRTLRECANA
jgi:hypothetical protein